MRTHSKSITRRLSSKLQSIFSFFTSETLNEHNKTKNQNLGGFPSFSHL
jgi:hypothetical protein